MIGNIYGFIQEFIWWVGARKYRNQVSPYLFGSPGDVDGAIRWETFRYVSGLTNQLPPRDRSEVMFYGQ